MPFVVNFTFTMVIKVSVPYAGWIASLSASLSLAFCSVGTHFYSWPRCTLFCRHPIYPVSSIIYRLRAGSRLESTRERRCQTAPYTTCPWWIPSLSDSLSTRACDSKAKPARMLRQPPFEQLVPVSRPKQSVIARARKIDKVSSWLTQWYELVTSVPKKESVIDAWSSNQWAVTLNPWS